MNVLQEKEMASFEISGCAINRIWINDHEYYMVGMGGVTQITVIMEPAFHCNMPWICVWIGDSLHSKWNAAKIKAVGYE